MKTWAEPLWTAAVARQIDAETSSRYHISADVLMNLAGYRVAEEARQLLAGTSKSILILAGTGNNGGDALVAARWLTQWQCGKVKTFIVSATADFHKTGGTAFQRELQALRSLGADIEWFSAAALQGIESPVLVIDGVLGTGFRAPLAPHVREALTAVSRLGQKTVIAIDTPSGLDVDTWQSSDVPLPADVTVTFGAAKPALILSPARDSCGRIVVADIGFPRAAVEKIFAERSAVLAHANPAAFLDKPLWQHLPPTAHKYTRGHILILGGSRGKEGAVTLTALAALRAGAGWVSVSVPNGAVRFDTALQPPLPMEATEEFFFSNAGKILAEPLLNFLEERKVATLVLGPGMMDFPWEVELLTGLMERSQKGLAVVCDGGALHGLLPAWRQAQKKLNLGPREKKQLAEKWLLTPHPGEWLKMDEPSPAAPSDLPSLAQTIKLAKELGLTFLYKSATPIAISAVDTALCTNAGTAILARAGSGDLLAGVAAAHLAAQETAQQAAIHGQIRVARASFHAAQEVGEHSVLATDIIRYLGKA